MDTSELMLAHIQSRINRIRSRCMTEQAVSIFDIFDKERLDELDMMLEVLRNAKNLQRLALPPLEAGSWGLSGGTETDRKLP